MTRLSDFSFCFTRFWQVRGGGGLRSRPWRSCSHCSARLFGGWRDGPLPAREGLQVLLRTPLHCYCKLPRPSPDCCLGSRPSSEASTPCRFGNQTSVGYLLATSASGLDDAPQSPFSSLAKGFLQQQLQHLVSLAQDTAIFGRSGFSQSDGHAAGHQCQMRPERFEDRTLRQLLQTPPWRRWRHEVSDADQKMEKEGGTENVL